MSTDDLVRRARALAAIDAPWTDRALVSELADEVDRLRAYYDASLTQERTLSAEVERLTARTVTLSETRTRLLAKYPHVGCDLEREEVEAERDAARAALERVRGVLDDYLGDHVTNAHALVLHVARALEGES